MWHSGTNRGASPPSRMPDLPRTRAHLEQGLGENRWTGYSLAVRKKSRLLCLAGGDVPAPPTHVPWFSAGKPVTAAGVLRVLETSPELGSEPMATTFPELAGSPIGDLSLEAILSHQTGLRIAESDLRGERGKILTDLAKVRPSDFQLTPGQAAYDPAGGWWLLGQWLERRSGKPWQVVLQNDLLGPAGLEDLGFYPAAVPMMERRAGKWIPAEPGAGPGAGLTGSAAALALFYEKLIQGQLLTQVSLQRMLHPARKGRMDATLAHVVDFGLGVILNSNAYGADKVPYGFGTRAGAGTFGHGGARSSIAFADPEFGFSAAVFLNGRVPEVEHQPRMRMILDLLRSELA